MSKQYEVYKDSGVEWLGEIPEHWKLSKLKYVASCNQDSLPESTEADYKFKYIDISSVSLINGVERMEEMFFEGSPSRARRKVKSGDIIVSTVRTYLKAIAYLEDIDDNVIVSTGFAVLTPNESANRKYISYFVKNDGFVGAVVANSVGVSYPAINASDLVKLDILLPPTDEQKAIADYLDYKTGQIDKLIAQKEQLMDLLQKKRQAIINEAVTQGLNPNAPRKKSGIQWLGEIPAHWEVSKIKFVAESVQTGNTPPTEVDEYFNNAEFNWFTPADFGESLILRSSKRKISDVALSKGVARVFKPKSVLLVGIGATLGKIGLCEGICSANQQINAITFKETFNPYFGAYFLKAFSEVIVSQSTASTLAILNQSKTGDLIIVTPPETEQKEIEQYLNFKTGHVDTVIKKLKKQIGILKSYRQSIISEVVTGKVDVREVVLNEA